MRVAAYARYSSDNQREASLEDQLRNCREFAARQGWPAPEPFTDAAISGSHAQRPSYRTLLASAHEFDIILVDDLSRLSRDSVEVVAHAAIQAHQLAVDVVQHLDRRGFGRSSSAARRRRRLRRSTHAAGSADRGV